MLWKQKQVLTHNIEMSIFDMSGRIAYFLLLLPPPCPPVESKSDASSVAGFFEAIKAEIRRYFAEVDIWKSISSEVPLAPWFFAILFLLVVSLCAEDLRQV